MIEVFNGSDVGVGGRIDLDAEEIDIALVEFHSGVLFNIGFGGGVPVFKSPFRFGGADFPSGIVAGTEDTVQIIEEPGPVQVFDPAVETVKETDRMRLVQGDGTKILVVAADSHITEGRGVFMFHGGVGIVSAVVQGVGIDHFHMEKDIGVAGGGPAVDPAVARHSRKRVHGHFGVASLEVGHDLFEGDGNCRQGRKEGGDEEGGDSRFAGVVWDRVRFHG